MSNGRLIFWLFLSAVAAVMANLFLSWQTPKTSVSSGNFLLDPAFDVLSVSISGPNHARTVLSKESGKWMLVAPYAGTVDAENVLRLVDAFTFARIEDTLSASELFKLGRKPEDFGLRKPRLNVTFSNAVETVEIAFGAYAPMTNEVYAVRSGSDAVYVVPSSVFAAADLSTDAFREREIFPFESEFITGFDLKKPSEALLSFTRDGESWRIGEGAASVRKVSEFLALLSDARAESFVWPIGATNETTVASAAFLSGYGLDADSAVVVTLRCRDGIDRRLLLGREVNATETYALINGGEAIVTLPTALKTAALQNARTFSDARLFPLAEAGVTSFSISDGVTAYIVARESADAWRLDAPIAAPADAKFAAGVLERLLALTPTDLDPTGLKVTVSTNNPSFVVSARSLIGAGRLDDFRSREILKVDPTLVRRLVSTPGEDREEGSVSLVRMRERRTWGVESARDGKGGARLAAIEQVLANLASLQAVRVETVKASSADLSRFGLEKPFHTLAFDLEKSDVVRRNILIGAATKDGYYATVGSSEAVFVLSKKIVDELTASLVEN